MNSPYGTLTPTIDWIAVARWNHANKRARREYEDHPLLKGNSCSGSHRCWWRGVYR